MVAAAKYPKVTVAASSDSLRNVPVVDSCTGTTEDASASGLQLTTPKPPGRRPFLEQLNLTPNRDEQVAKVEEMEKKIADLEAIITELKNKHYSYKEIDSDDGTLKPLHSKDMKPPPNLDPKRTSSLARELHIHAKNENHKMDEGGGLDKTSS